MPWYKLRNLILASVALLCIDFTGAVVYSLIYLPETDPTNDYDYDGFGMHQTPFEGLIGEVSFSGFAELRRLTTE